MPIAFARSAGWVKSIMISDSATAETTAPPRPCTARAMTRNSCEPARPQASEETVNSAIPTDEQAPVTEQVAEPAAEQQEPAEREQVGVHHPGERGLREAQIRPDRRQGDVHDRRVEDDHQVPAAEHDERDPAHAVRQSKAYIQACAGRHKPQSCCPNPRGSGGPRTSGGGSVRTAGFGWSYGVRKRSRNRLTDGRLLDADVGSAPPCHSTVASVPGSVAIVASGRAALPRSMSSRSPSTRTA